MSDEAFHEVASGLRFPEGPVLLPDGSIAVVEMEAGRVRRIGADGTAELVAATGGGPNGAALGPDGKLYVCNNGGSFSWHEQDGVLLNGNTPETWEGGRIERIDLDTGEVEVVYEAVDGRRLRGPNDLVFDAHGGFWFTDFGLHYEREVDRGSVYYARADGSMIREEIFPLDGPNGIGLSPDGSRLYVAETFTGRLWYWDVSAPGQLVRAEGLLPNGGTLLVGLPGLQLFDSLAVDAAGNICVATVIPGGITIVSPDGASTELVSTDDIVTTNICFGGDDLQTAYVTLASTGRLVARRWPEPGFDPAAVARGATSLEV